MAFTLHSLVLPYFLCTSKEEWKFVFHYFCYTRFNQKLAFFIRICLSFFYQADVSIVRHSFFFSLTHSLSYFTLYFSLLSSIISASFLLFALLLSLKASLLFYHSLLLLLLFLLTLHLHLLYLFNNLACFKKKEIVLHLYQIEANLFFILTNYFFDYAF